jgi:LacI family transcriptional regulator
MNKKYRPVKLEDLAKKLKVSKVTISKALRDHPDISVGTTAKVKELAEKMGYMPNVMAKNLSARKSNTIGLVIPKIAHIFFASVIESIYNTAFENNYEIVLTVSQEKAERERKHILSLLSMRVDGLLVSVTQETKDITVFERASKNGVPLIFIDRAPNMAGISSVTVDDEGGAYSAIDYAIKKGYTKIAHIGGPKNINIGRKRYEGFVRAMRDNRIPINQNWVIEGGFGEEDGYNGFIKIYEKRNIPEYIFASTYPIALGIYAAAEERGLSIPEDIEVTCFGKNNFNTFSPSVFNFVDQPTQQLGSEAVRLMLEQINNQDSVPKNIILNTELIIRNSNSKKGLARY